jgi:NAD+ synthase
MVKAPVSPASGGVRPALLVIDMQRGYFRDEAELARLRRHLPAINRLIAAFSEAELPVVMVRTVHAADGSTWTLKMRAQGKGVMLEGSPDVADVDGLAVPPSALSVTKTRRSPFVRTDIEPLLRSEGVDALVLCGIFLEACIGDTAADGVEYDFPVTVARDATLSSHPERGATMQRFLKEEFDVDCVAVDDVIVRLPTRAARARARIG